MNHMNNSAMAEKAIFFVIIITLIVAGLLYKEDFKGEPVAAIVWFGILGIALSRLIYFFIKKR